jgi:hypothetical protein
MYTPIFGGSFIIGFIGGFDQHAPNLNTSNIS